MKLSFTLLFAMILAFSACSHRIAPADESLKSYISSANWDKTATFDFQEPVQFTLSNGLRVFLIERRDIPMVFLRTQVRGGSIYDPSGKEGLAYLTGWVLTEGAQSYPDELIDATMDSHGAILTSQAFSEACIATLTCLNQDMPTLFPLYAGILSTPLFDEANIRESVGYLKGDLLRQKNDLGELVFRRFRADVFGDHPYSKPYKGTMEGLNSITRSDVVSFYNRYYRPDQAVLIAVGAISEAELKLLCENHLASWTSKDLLPLPAIEPPQPIKGLTIRIIDQDAVQAQIAMGHIGIDRRNPDQFSIDVLSEILGGGSLSSRLGNEVRVNRGLTYGIYSFFAKREFTGEFAVSTFTKIESVGEVVTVILDELKKIRDNPVTADELRDAKQGLIGQFPLRFEEYEGLAEEISYLYYNKLPVEYVRDYSKKIAAITVNDVQNAAQHYIDPENMVITIIGPADQIEPQLRAFGTIERVPSI